MKMQRRRFMQSVAALTATIRSQADQALAGVSTITPPAIGRAISMMTAGEWAKQEMSQLVKKRFSLSLLSGVIPQWKKLEIKQQSKHRSRVLDPDIVSMKSVSLSYKFLMQRQRSYSELEHQFWNQTETDLERATFASTHGVDI